MNAFFAGAARLLHLHIHRPLAENEIRLRPVRMFDSRLMHSGFASDDFLAANALTRPITSSRFLIWWWIKKTFVFSYCILINGKRSGFIGLHNLQPCAAAEISLALFERDLRRKGYGSRAFHLFVHDLEKHQFVKKISVRVSQDNFISLSFCKKLGFEEIHGEDRVRILLFSKNIFE
jgi:RimJ/RimL family protein N-acetyltransferase